MKHILFIILLATTTLYANESRSPDITYKLFTVMKLDKTFQETLDKMVDVQIVQNPSIAPAKATMMKFFEKHMGWESMKPELAKIYMKHYTDEELKELTTFYQTPVGQKTALIMPAISAEGAALGQKRVQDNMGELQEMLQKEFQK